jgi:hypothetical protein
MRSVEKRRGKAPRPEEHLTVRAPAGNSSMLRALSTRRGAKIPLRSAHADPEQDASSLPPAKPRTGIVSVNGRDVGKMCCSGGHRSG